MGRVKIYTTDARMLAHLLRADLIPQCHIGSGIQGNKTDDRVPENAGVGSDRIHQLPAFAY